MNTDKTELDRILELIGRIAEITADGDFIYRGEPQHYERVSSSLWRECRKEIESEEFDVGIIQKQMLEAAKDYTHTAVMEGRCKACRRKRIRHLTISPSSIIIKQFNSNPLLPKPIIIAASRIVIKVR